MTDLERVALVVGAVNAGAAMVQLAFAARQARRQGRQLVELYAVDTLGPAGGSQGDADDDGSR
jgi:hypothetical protein